MDESSVWDTEQEDKLKKVNPKVQRASGSESRKATKDQQKFSQQKQQSQKFIANNILDDEELKHDYSFHNFDNQYQEPSKKVQLSMVQGQNDEEEVEDGQLKPDKQVDMSTWDVTQEQKHDNNISNQKKFGQKQRGNRARQNNPSTQIKTEKQQITPQRGNRRPNNQQNYSNRNVNSVHQIPEGRNQNFRDQNKNNAQQRSGRGNRVYSEQDTNEYRGRGRGRGRGGYNNNYNNYRERDYDNSDSSRNNNWKYNTQNNNEGGNFKKKPYNYEQKKNQNQNETESSQYTGRGGYRGGGYQGSGYRGRGNFNNNYNNERNDCNNNRNQYRNSDIEVKREPETIIKEVVIQKQVVKQIIKEVQVHAPKNYPKARKCWPTHSIIILGCQLSVTYRKIQTFKNDILVVPYRQPKLDLYPGNFVHKSTADYKKKIIEKGQRLKNDGSVYIQRCVDLQNFTGFAFLRIVNVDKSIKNGVRQVLKQVGKLKSNQKIIKSIVFPVCKELGDPTVYLKQFCQQIQNFSKVEEIIITTQNSQLYLKASECLLQIIEGYMKQNQITIY